jgi:hypothetical protein
MKLMKALQILSSLLTAIFLSACASSPPLSPTSKDAAAQLPRRVAIEGRVQLQDKQEKKTFTITLSAVAIEPSHLRLDLNGPFGKALGKVVIRGETMGLLVPAQKRVYIGVVSENSFRPVLPLTMHPMALMSLLLGDVPSDWECVFEAADKQVCVKKEMGLLLTRDPRPEMRKSKWRVDGEKFSMVFLPTNIQTNVQTKLDTFALPIPEGYSRHKLP